MMMVSIGIGNIHYIINSYTDILVITLVKRYIFIYIYIHRNNVHPMALKCLKYYCDVMWPLASHDASQYIRYN